MLELRLECEDDERSSALNIRQDGGYKKIIFLTRIFVIFFISFKSITLCF
jgi:hypothetical protein